MANNRRDLHIGITGDSGGFDKACEEAETKARGLDRELEKLTRQQTAQERVTARATVAISKFGSEQDKAALSARKLGIEAERAGQQAERAQIRADAAAQAYERGLIDEEKALRAAARAEDATERAAIKAAEAHRAAARAADEQAQQERKLAREAELAAAAERLGQLKAAGAAETHNSVLRELEAKFGDLSKEGSGAFKMIESEGTSAFGGVSKAATSLAESGPGAIALLVAALAAVPFAATAAEAAVGLGLGGALAGLGLKAVQSDEDVKAALAGMKAHVLTEAKDIAAPFKNTWFEIARTAQDTFHALAPELKKDFAELAPAVSSFVHDAGYSITLLQPAFHASTEAADRLLEALGPRLPDITQNLGHSIEILANGAARSAPAFANMLVAVSEILPPLAHLIDLAVKAGPAVNLFYGAVSGGAATLGSLRDGLSWVTGGLIGAHKGLETAGGSFQSFDQQANSVDHAVSELDKDMQTLASSTASTEDKTKALTDAFARLLDPQQAVYRDTAQLQQGINDLGTALARSGGNMGDASQAARDAKGAFDGLLKNAQQLATDMTSSGQSIDQVRQGLTPYIGALYQAAGSNSQARDMVDAFVRSLGMVPPEFARAGSEVAGFGGKLDALKVPMSGAQLTARQLAEDFQILTTKTASAEDKANALSDAFTRLLDPALAAYQDTAHLRQGLDDLVAALKKSHGALNDNSAAARASKDAFAGLLKDAEQYAGDLLRSGDSLDTVQRKLAPYIVSLYKAAGANKDAKALVDAFARSVGLVPGRKGTTLTSNAAAQKRAIEAYQRSINALHGKTVDIFQVMHLTQTQAYLNQRKNILGYAHGGLVTAPDGGPAQRLADGGPSGMVTGPGTGTSDSILTALSNREFVVNAAATAANLPLLEAINSGRRVPVAAAAVMSGASGGSSAPINYDRLATALTQAMRREGVGAAYLDGQLITDNSSRRMGRMTDQRRRTG